MILEAVRLQMGPKPGTTYGIEAETSQGWILLQERFPSAEQAHDHVMMRGLVCPWRIVELDDGDDADGT